ncbi:hypothetical protein A9239_12375 [Methanosarcina sp. A14]|nr:hypothetical protein A9239_12375 [Methanosarcina sp. A14]
MRIIDLTLNTITREHLFKYLFIETLPRRKKIRGNRQCPAISEYLDILRDKLQINSEKIKIKLNEE